MMHAVGFSSSSFKFALTSCCLESGEFKCKFLDPDAATSGFDIGSDVLSETFGAGVYCTTIIPSSHIVLSM